MENNWLLIALAAYVAVKAFVSYKKGFARMLLSLSAAVLTLFLVWFAAPAVRDFIFEHTDMQEMISARLDMVISERLPGISAEELLHSGEILPEALAELVEEKLGGAALSGIHMLTMGLSRMLVSAAVCGILFLALWLGLKIAGYMLRVVTRLPVLKQLNGFAGMVLGLLEALLVIEIIFLLITAFMHTEPGLVLMEQIRGNAVLSFMYDKNLLLQIAAVLTEKI